MFGNAFKILSYKFQGSSKLYTFQMCKFWRQVKVLNRVSFGQVFGKQKGTWLEVFVGLLEMVR